ncbi:hypothetical protein ACH47Z_18440 [Streptomyces sp. NPDC020192]|uniref:hypothetical protein n=1 Tax=Streptomyces sp. NPDC020192 TaxID=3365066 RepID=UPI00378EF8F8
MNISRSRGPGAIPPENSAVTSRSRPAVGEIMSPAARRSPGENSGPFATADATTFVRPGPEAGVRVRSPAARQVVHARAAPADPATVAQRSRV